MRPCQTLKMELPQNIPIFTKGPFDFITEMIDIGVTPVISFTTGASFIYKLVPPTLGSEALLAIPTGFMPFHFLLAEATLKSNHDWKLDKMKLENEHKLEQYKAASPVLILTIVIGAAARTFGTLIRGELGSSRFRTFGQLYPTAMDSVIAMLLNCSIILLLSFFSISLPFIRLLVRQFLETILPVASKYDVARSANSIPYKGFRARNMGWFSSFDSLGPAMANYRSFSGCVRGGEEAV